MMHDGQVGSGGVIDLKRGLLVIPEHLQFRTDKTDAIRSVTVVLPLSKPTGKLPSGMSRQVLARRRLTFQKVALAYR